MRKKLLSEIINLYISNGSKIPALFKKAQLFFTGNQKIISFYDKNKLKMNDNNGELNESFIIQFLNQCKRIHFSFLIGHLMFRNELPNYFSFRNDIKSKKEILEEAPKSKFGPQDILTIILPNSLYYLDMFIHFKLNKILNFPSLNNPQLQNSEISTLQKQILDIYGNNDISVLNNMHSTSLG